MNTYYISSTKNQGGGHTFHEDPPSFPHYVARADGKDEAITLVEGYRTGFIWAIERALVGDILIDSHPWHRPTL
jgi:hypothetical protein